LAGAQPTKAVKDRGQWPGLVVRVSRSDDYEKAGLRGGGRIQLPRQGGRSRQSQVMQSKGGSWGWGQDNVSENCTLLVQFAFVP
jgi:hypothetical protein